jgi:hypothetical protein
MYILDSTIKLKNEREVLMPKNWGPYFMVSSSLKKTNLGKVALHEAFDYDLLRQELITAGLPLEIVRVNNPWYYRKKNTDKWLTIGESSDMENNFLVEWDISTLENGSYEIMASMQVIAEENCLENIVTIGQCIAEVAVRD